MKLTTDQKKLLATTMLQGATADEMRTFVATWERSGLDPFAKQIGVSFRWNKQAGREVMNTYTTIDGFRSIAARSGKYAGQNGPYWCGQDGVWKDVWLSKDPPAAAKVEILHKDFDKPLTSTATWDQYVQTTKENKPNRMWLTMGPMMLGKCAESLGLRRAFPELLGGLYTSAEMGQSDSHPEPAAPPAEPEGANAVEKLKNQLKAKNLPMATGADVEERIGDEGAKALCEYLAKSNIELDDVRAAIREMVPVPAGVLERAPNAWPVSWKDEVRSYVRDVLTARKEQGRDEQDAEVPQDADTPEFVTD